MQRIVNILFQILNSKYTFLYVKNILLKTINAGKFKLVIYSLV